MHLENNGKSIKVVAIVGMIVTAVVAIVAIVVSRKKRTWEDELLEDFFEDEEVEEELVGI